MKPAIQVPTPNLRRGQHLSHSHHGQARLKLPGLGDAP